MAANDDITKEAGGKMPDGFRMRYIAERLKELNAERERLVEERRAIMARRKASDNTD